MKAGEAAALRADAVHFAYGLDPVLRGVTFAVAHGEFVALAGPNGSGKSTLLRIMLGLLRADEGTVEVLGAPPGELREPWRVGYVPQRTVVPEHLPATVREVVGAGRIAKGRWTRRLGTSDHDAVEHALVSVGAADLGRRRMHELSGGQQQRVLIAKALVTEPDVLILDEPVTGVDAQSQRTFRDSVVHLAAEHGSAVFLVSHDLGAVASDLDRVLVLQRGVLVFDGAPKGLTEAGVHLGTHTHDLPVWLEGLS